MSVGIGVSLIGFVSHGDPAIDENWMDGVGMISVCDGNGSVVCCWQQVSVFRLGRSEKLG